MRLSRGDLRGLDLSRLTRGEPMPGCERATGAGSAILLSAEDSPALTLKPRLLAAGADLSKVSFCSGVRYLAEPMPGAPAFHPPAAGALGFTR